MRWYYVVTGPDNDHWNSFVRLNPDSNDKGSEVQVSVTGLAHWHHGDTWLIDDGELIVACRTLEAIYLGRRNRSIRSKRWLRWGWGLSLHSARWAFSCAAR